MIAIPSGALPEGVRRRNYIVCACNSRSARVATSGVQKSTHLVSASAVAAVSAMTAA